MPRVRLPSWASVAILAICACLATGIAASPYSARARQSALPTTADVPARASTDQVEWGRQSDESGARAGGRYANGSIVVEQRFWSAALDREMRYRVFFPPEYAFERRSYPVLYMLHGVAGGSSEWEELGLLDAADHLIAAGEIDPMLIVLPDGGPNYWANHADGTRWGDFVVEDVVAVVDRLYRTRPERHARAVGGLSMGGEGALRLALLHPDVFGIAAAHAPSLRTSYAQLSEDLRALYGDPDRWRSLSPYWLVSDGDAAERLTLSIDVGEDDPWRDNAEALHERLLAYDIEHTFAVLEGEHNATYWQAHRDRFLRFYSRAFARSTTAE